MAVKPCATLSSYFDRQRLLAEARDGRQRPVVDEELPPGYEYRECPVANGATVIYHRSTQVVVSPSVRRLGRSHSGKYTYLFMYADANLFREVNGTGSVFELWALIRAQYTDPHLRCTATQFSSPPSGLVRLTTREPAYFAISNKKTKFLSGSLLRAKARILQASYYDPCDYQFSRTGTPCDFCVPLRAPSEWMYVCCGALVAVTIALIRRLSLFRATPLILVGIADFLSCGLLVCIGLELHELDLPTSDVHTDRVVMIQPDSSIEGDSESVSTTFSAIYNTSKKGAVDK
ncbi:hypothetical protein FOZ62_018029, partial [Perkinsus olseni]